MNIEQLIEYLKNFDSGEFQKIGQGPFVIRVFLWGISFVATLVLALVFISMPKYEETQKLVEIELSLKDRFVKESRKAANKDKYEEQLLKIQDYFGVLLKKLPTKIEVDRLVENINQNAKKNDVKIVEQQPGELVVNQIYNELALRVEFTGNYHNISRFFNDLVVLTQIITLHNIKLDRIDASVGIGNIKGNVTAKIYSYVPEDQK